MNKEKKMNYIKTMTTQFDKSEAVIVTHYQGLTVKQLDELRNMELYLRSLKTELLNLLWRKQNVRNYLIYLVDQPL